MTENKRSYPSLLYQDEEFNQRLMADLQQVHEKWCGRRIKKSAVTVFASISREVTYTIVSITRGPM